MKTFAFTFTVIFLLLTSLNVVTAKENIPENQNWDKREHVYKTSDSFSEFEILYKGKILVNDDDSDIKSISPNGYLKIQKSSFGNKRAIIIESNSKGELNREYYEGKTKLDFYPNGKDWFEDILLEVIHHTGIGGKERVIRIYNKEGLRGVFDEIEEFGDSYTSVYIKGFSFGNFISYDGPNVKNLYFKTIIDDITLTKDGLADYLRELPEVKSNSTKGTILRTIIDKYTLDSYLQDKLLKATATLDYNTERGNTLRKFITKYPVNKENADDFFDVIREMEINTEKGDVMKFLLSNQKLDKTTYLELLSTLQSFSLDSEKASVLRHVARYMPNDSEIVEAYKNTVWSLSDSYRYLREELTYMLPSITEAEKKYEKQGLIDILDMAKSYDANTKKSTTLRKLHPSLINDPVIIEKYFTVVRSMNNYMEKYNLMIDLLNTNMKFDNTYVSNIINIAEDVRDDNKWGSSQILRKLIPILPNDEIIVKSYFDVLEDIDHDSAKEEIIRMLCERGKLDNYTILKMMETVQDIEVDIEMASSMLKIRTVMPKNNPELELVFNNVANKIDSDYEYEKLYNQK